MCVLILTDLLIMQKCDVRTPKSMQTENAVSHFAALESRIAELSALKKCVDDAADSQKGIWGQCPFAAATKQTDSFQSAHWERLKLWEHCELRNRKCGAVWHEHCDFGGPSLRRNTFAERKRTLGTNFGWKYRTHGRTAERRGPTKHSRKGVERNRREICETFGNQQWQSANTNWHSVARREQQNTQSQLQRIRNIDAKTETEQFRCDIDKCGAQTKRISFLWEKTKHCKSADSECEHSAVTLQIGTIFYYLFKNLLLCDLCSNTVPKIQL